MGKEPKIIAEEIHLLAVENTLFRLCTDAFKKAESYHLNEVHKVLHNLNDQRIKLELTLFFENQEKKELLFLQTDYHFQVENLLNFLETNDKDIPIFFAPLIATLLGISLSTSRGILLEKLSAAGIHNIIIPIVSPMKMIK